MSHLSGRRRRALVLLLSMIPAVVAFLDHRAGAAEDDQDLQPVEIERHAYYTHSASASFPAALGDNVPPGAVCLAAAVVDTNTGVPAQRVCGDEIQALKALLSDTPLTLDGSPIPQTPDDRLPQAIPPDSMPVGMLAGVPRYLSTVEFRLPVVPFGEEISRYQLVLPENPNGINAAFESPAFREAVFAAFGAVFDQSEAPLVDFFEALVAQEIALANPAPTGVEACPIVGDWQAGRAQSADVAPEVDCIFGSTGEFDPDERTWTFDLTFAAQGWNSGDLDDNGILLRPLGADNLAYGDPDLSTNFVLNLSRAQEGDAVPQFLLSTVPAPEPVSGFPSLGAPPAPSPVVGNTDPFVSPGPEPTAEPAPQAAPPVEQAAPQPISSDRDIAWYAWLMLPIGLGIAFAFGGALDGTPATARASRGALSRLMDVRRG